MELFWLTLISQIVSRMPALSDDTSFLMTSSLKNEHFQLDREYTHPQASGFEYQHV